jgi:hypothetical protein
MRDCLREPSERSRGVSGPEICTPYPLSPLTTPGGLGLAVGGAGAIGSSVQFEEQHTQQTVKTAA